MLFLPCLNEMMRMVRQGLMNDVTAMGIFFSIILIIFFLFEPAPQAAELYRFSDEEGQIYYTNIPGEDRQKVSLAQKIDDSIPLPINPSETRNPSQNRFEPIIASASQLFTVDPDLVRAIIKAESNFNPRAISPKGAMGLMQLMSQTAREMDISNPFDPLQNIHAGVRYLDGLLQRLNQNLPLALAAYNAGPTRVLSQKGIPPIEETRNYVQRVMKYYRDFKKKSKNMIHF